jgi:hypothetical protein
LNINAAATPACGVPEQGTLGKEKEMDIVQLQQQPEGTKRAVNSQVPTVCPHGKKPFSSREEAEQLEADNRKRFPKQSRQYAYQCPECSAYHLTSKSRDAYAIGPSNLKRLGMAMEDVGKPSVSRKPRGETEAEVKRLWEKGISDADIASQLGISTYSAGYHRKKFGSANTRAKHGSALRLLKSPLTLSEFDEQKRLLDEEYQAKLLRLEQQKQQHIEANRLTVVACQEGQAVQEGNVVLDKKTQCWFFRYYQDGKRPAIRLGSKREIPTRSEALRRAEPVRREINKELEVRSLLVRDLWKQYRQEKMSERFATRHAYESWARNHILPRWGSHVITDLQARPER